MTERINGQVEASPQPNLSVRTDGGRFRLPEGKHLMQSQQAKCSVRTPSRREFIRVRQGPEGQLETYSFRRGKNRQFDYLVEPKLWDALRGRLLRKVLRLCASDIGGPFLWPVTIERMDGKAREIDRSILHLFDVAATRWVKATWDGVRGYTIVEAQVEIAEPTWPISSLDEIVQRAFGGRCIGSLDHPALRLR